MVIEEFQGSLENLKNLSAQPPDDALGRQEIVATHAVLVGRKSNSNHGVPRLKCTKAWNMSQADKLKYDRGAMSRKKRKSRTNPSRMVSFLLVAE
jgi:hypothetical protein